MLAGSASVEFLLLSAFDEAAAFKLLSTEQIAFGSEGLALIVRGIAEIPR